jgi:ABC-2 type transport system ATP-binding protein
MAAAIIASELRYSYGHTLAVDGVGVDVAPREVLGLLGPNGAGKSTTITTLTGQRIPHAGHIEITAGRGLDT